MVFFDIVMSRVAGWLHHAWKSPKTTDHDYHQTDTRFPFSGKQTKTIKKRQAVKGNAKKLHGSCHAETVAIFLQSPCRIQ